MGTTNETASNAIPTGDQGSVRGDCPTCGRVTTLARCGNENVFRCIECKALYTGEMLAAAEMRAALWAAIEVFDYQPSEFEPSGFGGRKIRTVIEEAITKAESRS